MPKMGRAWRVWLKVGARVTALMLIGALQTAHAATMTPYLEAMTWTELRDRIAAGATTVLVPIGGTEQNGPHMVLGKHNVRAHLLAGRIAERLGGYQQAMVRVAARLNREWAKQGDASRAYALADYYAASQAEYAAMLKARGFSAHEIGVHAGLADASLALALDPALVRQSQLGTEPPKYDSGTDGDPRRATAELGQIGVDHFVDASAKAIRAFTSAR